MLTATVVLWLSAAWGATGLAEQEVDETSALSSQIEKHIEKREWKEARAAAKKLKRLLPREERKEATALLLRIAGREAYFKIHDRWIKSPNPAKAQKQLSSLLKKYGRDAELRKLAGILQQKIRVELYYVIDDFEEEVDLESWKPVRKKELVKQGSVAAHWRSQSLAESGAYAYCDERDWTKFSHLVLWIYNADPKSGGTITLDPYGDGHDRDYFQQIVTINWKGWRELRLPLHGKHSRFQRHGKAEWTKIDALRFWKEEGRKIDIVVDDIRLERAVAAKRK